LQIAASFILVSADSGLTPAHLATLTQLSAIKHLNVDVA
jgi:hypothetical protein